MKNLTELLGNKIALKEKEPFNEFLGNPDRELKPLKHYK